MLFDKTKKICIVLGFASLNACSIINKDIEFKSYPNTHETLVREGEAVVFEINPKEKRGFSIDFGDGQSKKISTSDIMCLSKNDCNPVYIEHTYQLPGGFTPVVTYKNKQYPEDIGVVVIASKSSLTNRELKIKAIEDLVKQVESSLKDQNMICDSARKSCNKKISVGVLQNANFEYEKDSEGEMQDLMLVKSLKHRLVKSGFSVIEKHPQALVRLAHDSVIDAGITGEGDFSNKDYRDYLEYGLATTYVDDKKPFVYSLKMEGMADRITEQKSLSDKEEKTKNSNINVQISEEVKEEENFVGDNVKKQESNVERVEEEKADKSNKKVNVQTKQAGSRVRPLLYAKFDTANYLLLIDRIKDLKVDEMPNYYSMTYNKKITKRVASVNATIRLLERTGNIVWMGNFKGVASDISQKNTIMPIKIESEKYNDEYDGENKDNVASQLITNKVVDSIPGIGFLGGLVNKLNN